MDVNLLNPVNFHNQYNLKLVVLGLRWYWNW